MAQPGKRRGGIRRRHRMGGKSTSGLKIQLTNIQSAGNFNTKGNTTATTSSSADLPDPQEAIQPDFLNSSGEDSLGEENYAPSGGSEDDGFEEPKSEADDKDASNAKENSDKEPDKDDPDLAKLESGNGGSDGIDRTGVSKEENDDENQKYSSWINYVKAATNKKAKARRAGLFVLIGTIGIVISMFTAIVFLPGVAIKSVMTNINNVFFGRVDYAVETVTEQYVQRYLSRKLLPTSATCGNIINNTCLEIKPGKGIIGRVYSNWSQNNIELKLKKKYGITFEVDRRRGTDIFMKKDGKIVATKGKNTIAKEATKYFKLETKQQGILERRHIRSLLASKYGAKKWCLIACKTKDSIDRVQARLGPVKRLKIRLANRIGSKFSAKTGAYLLCMTIDCTPEKLLADTRKVVQTSAATFSDDLLRSVDGALTDSKFTQVIARKLFEKVLSVVLKETTAQATARSAAAAIPLVGQIYLALTLIDLVDRIDDSLENYSLSNAIEGFAEEAYAGGYAAIAAGVDDVTSLEAPVSEVQGMYQLLDGYDASPTWQEITNTPTRSTNDCDDGSIVGGNTGKLVCDDQKVDVTLAIEEIRNSSELAPVASIVNLYDTCLVPEVAGKCAATPQGIIRPLLKKINDVFGALFITIFSGAKAVDFTGTLDRIENWAKVGAEAAFKLIVDKVAQNPYQAAAQGVRALDQLAIGANVTASNFNKGFTDEDGTTIGLGAPKITAEQGAELDKAIAQRAQEEESHKGVFERYFDVNNQKSLASITSLRLASILPLGGKILSPVFSPLTAFSSVGSILTGNKLASAAAPDSILLTDREAFAGVDEYAYPVGDRAFSVDPDTLIPQQCSAYAAEQEASKIIVNGKEEVTVSNPCMLHGTVADTLTKKTDLDPDNAVSSTGVGTNTTTLDIDNLTGPIIPCQGSPVEAVREGDHSNWSSLPPSGVIGKNSADQDINVYVREACAGITNPRTVIIGSSIHGSENGGQLISHELLFNMGLPPDVRIVAIPEINKWGIPTNTRKNKNGVDLNRNWNYEWSSVDNVPISDDNYKGLSAESEPETMAVANFLRSVGPSSLFISFHDNINWVAAVDEKSKPIAERYSQLASIPYGKDNGEVIVKGRGYMEAWYNQETSSPALLVELTNERSVEYINRHADAIKKLLEENVVR